MARLIDADAFIEEHCADCKYFNVDGICTKEDPVCGSVMMVNELPTVDAVEVVRCKDCKHGFLTDDGSYSCELVDEHYGWGYRTKADDFCSYGERRTDES